MNFRRGDKVRTKSNRAVDPDEWTEEGLRNKVFGITGIIVDTSNSHGQCFLVRHDGPWRESGSMAWYDPLELELDQDQIDWHEGF